MEQIIYDGYEHLTDSSDGQLWWWLTVMMMMEHYGGQLW